MPHGYTNDTVGDEATVRKTYAGPDARERAAREHAVLTRLRGLLPVPEVLGADGGTLTTRRVAGTPAQELIDAGHADAVLTACGRVLRRIHAVPWPGGGVLVHGDFGPNNLLLDPESFAVTAVVDWEWAHRGERVEDLAWCEWIVRTHHPADLPSAARFFAAYGPGVPPWPVRQAVMVERCGRLERFCRRWEPGGAGEALWRGRTAATRGWRE